MGDEEYLPIGYCPLSPSEVAALLKDPRVVHFDSELVLARHYAAQLFNQSTGNVKAFTKRQISLSHELVERLEQINFLCKTVAVLVRRRLVWGKGETKSAQEYWQLWFMIYLYAEAFYYFAHRVQDILRKDKRGNLPYVKGFVPSDQIIRIRNELIEHAYLTENLLESGGAKSVLSLNDGPIIQRQGEQKPRRGRGKRTDPTPDSGMFVNARAWKKALTPVVQRALDAVGGYVDADSLMPDLPTRTKRGQNEEEIS
jgi:hypothetical protein